MRVVETLADEKFVTLKKVVDPENNVNGYLYAERLGVDSVAFVCMDRKTKQVMINKEYKPPISSFVAGAFGGSLDKDVNLKQIVKAEVKEEAGFVVEEKDIVSVGKSFVSTQMNQYCHLFVVLVDKEKEDEREPENAIEAMAETVWVDEEFLLNPPSDFEDWKAIVAMVKYKAL